MSGDVPVRDILAPFEEHLKQAAAQSIKDMIEKTLGEQFKAMELAEQGLRKEIMDIRQQQQDTIAKYEMKQNDLQMQLEAEKRKNAEATRKLNEKLQHANTIAKSVAKDQEKLEKNVTELSATQRMTAGALEKVSDMPTRRL
jgi:chromosome segregation ATPase